MNITKVKIVKYKLINPIVNAQTQQKSFKSVAILAVDDRYKYWYIFDVAYAGHRKYLKGYIKRHSKSENLDTWGHALKSLQDKIISAPNIRYLEYVNGQKYIG